MGDSLSPRRDACRSRGLVAAGLAFALAGAHAEGLVLHPTPDPLRAPIEALAHAHAPATTQIRLVGDYYFFDPSRGDLGPALGSFVGGLRASTGIAGFGQPLNLYEAQPETAQNLPYLGLGYSHLWLNSQLSLNADFGLASQGIRSLANGNPSLDDITRELRWSPVMAVNVSYSF